MSTNWLKRTLCTVLVFVMVLGYVPATAFSAKEGGLCEHHTQHTEACGYSAAMERHICDCQPNEHGEFFHTDRCGYMEALAESPCTNYCEKCAQVTSEPKTVTFVSKTAMAASAGAVTCEQVTAKVLQYKSIIDQWCTSNNTSTAYWNAHVRSSSSSCIDGKISYSDPTGYIKSRVNEGDFTSYLTATPCPGNSHSHGKNTCYSNEFGAAHQCNGYANYMNYIVFGLTHKDSNGSVTSGFENFNFVPGDIAIYSKVGSPNIHFRYIYDVDDTYVYYVAGNDDGRCGICFRKMEIAEARNGYYTTNAFRPLSEVFRSAAVDADSMRGTSGSGSGESITPTLSISNWRDITDLDLGSNFGLRGTISTDCGVITSVTGSVHNSSGGVVLTHTDTPNTSTYNIQTGINNYLSFGRLSNGRYTIKVQATANNNGKTNTLELVNQSFTVGSINYYSFDINGLLDNVDELYLGDFGTCDVYISGELVADDCDDYYSQSIPEGSTYEIRDIRATDGHNYAGVYTGQLSGTVSGDTTVVLKFFSNPKANLSQSATDIVVDKYGAYITFSYTGDTAHGYGYTITSSDPSVATVSLLSGSSFAVNGVSVGTCKIVYQLVETDTYAILDTVECTVTVSREGVFGDGLAYNVTPEGHMTISGDGSIPDYNEERSPWVNWCSEIKKLTLSNGITGIGWSAFLSCDSLTEVTIANTVTDIEPSAFAHCTALQNVEIPGSVNTIQDGAFVGCSELKTVTLSEGVNCLQDGVFMNCSSLKSISIPRSMSSIGSYSFYNCVSLADVHYAGSIAQWGTLLIEDFNEALINANIQCDAPTIGGTCGEKLFWTLSDGVLTISGSGDMWDYSLDGEDTPWHSYRDAITSVVMEKGVTRVGDHAFQWCVKLEDVTLPDSIISIGFFAFGECDSLRSFTIPNGVTTIENDAFALCHNLSAISIPNSVVSIGDFAFTGCSSLSAITLPANLTSIGNGVFWGCGLSSIVIPNGVTSIGHDAFEKCSGMSSITLPDTVSTIGISSFSDCTSLITITIPDSLTTIGNYAFDNCTSLTSVTLEGTAPTIGIGAFRGVTANVYYPAEDATWTSDVMQNYFGTLTWIPYGDHEHFYTAVITAPTCTEQGYTTYTCNCGNYYVDDYVNALGHSETIVTGTSATCTEPGMTDGKVCKVCGVFTVKCEIIKALGHTEETISGKAATCTEDGLTDGTKCRLCDKVLVPQEVIPAGHTIEESGYKEPTCTEDGMSALKVCTVCHEVIQEQQILPACHKLVKKEPQKATLEEDGYRMECFVCSNCKACFKDESGEVAAEADCVIPAVETVRLSSTRYSYDGKTKTPKVGVYDSKGNKLVEDKDYTVTYAKGRKSVGQYNVTMKGTGEYSFRTTLTFQIVPPKSGIKALSGKSKAFTASWSKKTSQVTGYQLQYSLDKNFETGVKTVTIKDNDVTSKTIKSLKAKKYYYVRIRTYKTVSGKNFYSGWSDAARVKTK